MAFEGAVADVFAFHAGHRGPHADWFNHVNAHDHGGHLIPWENPDAWVNDLRRTFLGRTP